MTYRLDASIDPELFMVEKERVVVPVGEFFVLQVSVPSTHWIVEPFRLIDVTILGQPLHHISSLREQHYGSKWKSAVVI